MFLTVFLTSWFALMFGGVVAWQYTRSWKRGAWLGYFVCVALLYVYAVLSGVGMTVGSFT